MRKQILAITLAIMSLCAVPTYAATITAGAGQSASSKQSTGTGRSQSVPADPSIDWVLNPNDYKTYELRAAYGTDEWWKAEAVEQAKRWAENNKGDIPSIADEKARYEAIVTKVCDFLTPDEKYIQPHIAYAIRDGRGVCGDYATLTKALCDVCNIQAKSVYGVMNGDGHVMLKVTLNGKEYYSDPVNYDTGYTTMLSESVPSYFQCENTDGLDGLSVVAGTTGNSISAESSDIVEINNHVDGFSLVKDSNGYHYWKEEDSAAVATAIDSQDMDTLYAILDKYKDYPYDYLFNK